VDRLTQDLVLWELELANSAFHFPEMIGVSSAALKEQSCNSIKLFSDGTDPQINSRPL
jgi:hypothetical protein